MDRGAWQAIVQRVAKSQTRLERLSMCTHIVVNLLLSLIYKLNFTICLYVCIRKNMAYIEFGIVCDFRHPLGVLRHISHTYEECFILIVLIIPVSYKCQNLIKLYA